MNTNKWLVVVVVILVIQVASSLRLTMVTADLTEQVARVMRHVEPPGSVRGADIGVDTTRPYLGNSAASVHLVVFSDFQCPACAHLAPMIKQLAERFGDNLCISFRNYPLPSHDQSRLLASLGESAWRKCEFWNFHDSLFANQGKLDEARLKDLCRFAGIVSEPENGIERVVEDDLKLAAELEVKSTPTIFINGRRIIGAYPLSTFERIIGEELAAPNQRPMICEE